MTMRVVLRGLLLLSVPLLLAVQSTDALAPVSTEAAKKVGVLFASFGDVESCACVDSYFPKALERLVSYEVPVPSPFKNFTAKEIWKASRKETLAQYTAISPDCNTHFQENARAQADVVVSTLQSLDKMMTFKSYVGYNFIEGPGCPAGVTVKDQARLALKDGVEQLLVVNQNGAQQSNTTIGVAYEDLAPVLKEDPAWEKVEVIGLDDFSQVSSFDELLIQHTEKQLEASFGKKTGTCILFACHGNPARIGKTGDPGEALMRKNYATLSAHFATKNITTFLAFQNHGGKGQPFPQNLFPWSKPADSEVVPEIAKNPGCDQVLVSGSISFVVDNSETLFDEGIDDLTQLRKAKGNASVVVGKSFNADPAYAKFLAPILKSAIEKKGPIRVLNAPKAEEESSMMTLMV